MICGRGNPSADVAWSAKSLRRPLMASYVHFANSGPRQRGTGLSSGPLCFLIVLLGLDPCITRLMFWCRPLLLLQLLISPRCFFSLVSITNIKSVLTQKALKIFCKTLHIPDEADGFACPASFPWHTSKSVSKDPFPKSSKFNAEHYATLVAYPATFHKYPEPFLCLVGMSHYYTLDENTNLDFLHDNDEEMDLLAFIRTVHPTKVRIGERQRTKDEPKLLDTTIGRVVPLLLVAPAYASSELEVSVDKLFDEGGSSDQAEQHDSENGGQGVGIQLVSEAAEIVAEDVAPLGGVVPTLPFMKSSVFAIPEREGEDHTDFVAGTTLRNISPPQRFSISSDSSHHSSANVTEAEVDSVVSGVSSSAGGADHTIGGFSELTGSDFIVSGIRTVISLDTDLQKVYVPQWSITNGSRLDDGCVCPKMMDKFAPLKFFTSIRGMEHDQLFIEFNVRAARQMSLSAEVTMHAEYNIKEKRRLKFVVDEQTELLKDEVQALKEFNATLKKEKNDLDVMVADLAALVKVRECEVADLDVVVHELEASSSVLPEKVTLYTIFVEMALHLEERFYPHLLSTIYGRRWLLTHRMELTITKCTNSPKYLSVLGTAIGKAIEKGMQDGLSIRITHGKEGRAITDVAAYNPFTKADYIFAFQQLQHVNFSLFAELRSNKDASIEDLLNILHLEDALTEKFSLDELQPHVDQLMVPIHHSSNKTIIGATALSLALDVSNIRVQKIRDNIANYRSALRDVFIPLAEPLSAMALEGMEGTFDAMTSAATTMALSTTLVSTSTVNPISIDDYEVVEADDQAAAGVNDASFPNVDDVDLHISSTSAVLSVGMLIFAGMTASVLYVNENGVSLLLDFIIVRYSLGQVCELDSLGMLLLMPWRPCACHGPRKDFLYRVPLITVNHHDFHLTALAFFTSAGSVPSVRNLLEGERLEVNGFASHYLDCRSYEGEVGEQQLVKDEPKLLDTTIGRVVPLLPVAPTCASSELEAKIVAEDVAPLQPRPQKKRKTTVVDVGEPTHPAKKLKDDQGTPGGVSVGGKSLSAVQRLVARAVRNAKVRGGVVPTLPFVTSSVFTTPEYGGDDHTDSMAGTTLRTVGPPQRFVISSDSFHHSGANVTEAEVDSVVRSSVPMMTVATTVTSIVDPAGGADHTMGGFSELIGCDFIVSDDGYVCHKIVDEFAPTKFFASIHGMEHEKLFTKFNVRAARQMSLSAKVKMRAEYNIKEKRRLNSVVDEQIELLKLEAVKKSLQDEVQALKEFNATLEKEKNDLDMKVANLAASVKVREREVADLDAVVTSVKSQNDNLVDQAHDDRIKEVNDKFDKLYTDFVKMAFHLEERFYPHLLSTISGRRWLFTHGMELAITKCINSPEYLSVLGTAIGKDIEKGMQDRLSAGITHGKEGRAIIDVAAYNPSTKVDYIFALQQLQHVNFSLFAELRSNKDASIEDLMNILHLEDTLTEK
ncbi:hypothetical protein Tco_0606956 [Tanacetum coccineum]